MHYDRPPEETQPFKTREEQEEDFKFLSEYADKNCPTCYGRAFQGWSEKEQMYVPCLCLLANINKEIEKGRQDDASKGGILQTINKMFGRN